ncbi:MAG: hypothetical protein ACI956_000225, partial [Nonlabens sp.]
MNQNLIVILVILLFASCSQLDTKNTSNTETKTENTQSQIPTTIDAKASELADATLLAMGGQQKYDDLHYVSWTFFGSRQLTWDKRDSRVRINSPKDTTIYLLDMKTMKGKISKSGKEVTDPDALSEGLKRAKSIWINDSYWLVMPFKLKDPGVNLKYLRTDTTKTGAMAEVVELTFEGVGNTPNNKYNVFIDKKDNLVKQWAFYADKNQEAPSRVWPWDNYKDYNGLLLSGERSDDGGPSEIKVY